MFVKDPFKQPKCVPSYLDRWVIRRAILDVINKNLHRMHGVLLDVGCGEQPYKKIITAKPSKVSKYIGLDLVANPARNYYPDITWVDGKIPLEDDSIDCAIATEVLEHCPNPEVVLSEIWRVLKVGGMLIFTVPFLWPLHETPYDEYRYTPYSLNRHLSAVGFKELNILPMGGWDASLSQMLGLWLRRRPMNFILREILSILLLPIICLLEKKDSKRLYEIHEGLMITGLSGTAIKLN